MEVKLFLTDSSDSGLLWSGISGKVKYVLCVFCSNL